MPSKNTRKSRQAKKEQSRKQRADQSMEMPTSPEDINSSLATSAASKPKTPRGRGRGITRRKAHLREISQRRWNKDCPNRSPSYSSDAGRVSYASAQDEPMPSTTPTTVSARATRASKRTNAKEPSTSIDALNSTDETDTLSSPATIKPTTTSGSRRGRLSGRKAQLAEARQKRGNNKRDSPTSSTRATIASERTDSTDSSTSKDPVNFPLATSGPSCSTPLAEPNPLLSVADPTFLSLMPIKDIDQITGIRKVDTNVSARLSHPGVVLKRSNSSMSSLRSTELRTSRIRMGGACANINSKYTDSTDISYDQDGLSIGPSVQATGDPTDIDSELMPPPPLRRSTRVRRQPDRYTPDNQQNWTYNLLTNNCRTNIHKGSYCAAQSAAHSPSYYNTLKPYGQKGQFRCPYCGALLLKSEAHGRKRYSKCCAKGKIKMARQFYMLQRPFLRPTQRIREDEEAHHRLDDASKQLDCLLNELITGKHRLSDAFIKKVDRYNHELAFGSASTQQKPVPGGYQPILMNGMVNYRTSGLHPPTGKEELFGQVWTLNPEDAIHLRQQRNQQQGSPLNDDILRLMHELLGHDIIGHKLSSLYYNLKRIYDDEKQLAAAEGRSMTNFRIRLLTRQEVLARNINVNARIHPHRTLLPDNIQHLAQIYFVDDDDGLPPTKEWGVVLKTTAGELVTLPWWHEWIDGAICPLLFPRNDHLWEPSIPFGDPAVPDSFYQQCDDQADRISIASSVAGDDPDWENNPYENEEDGSQLGAEEENEEEEEDDDGEGEQFLLDKEPKKDYHVSRTQAARYMMQIRAPPRNAGSGRRNLWHDPHWLWWGRRLAEYYSCLLINRIERDKYTHIKKSQPNLRSVLPQHLIDSFERQVQAQPDPHGVPLGARGRLGRTFIAPSTLRGSRAYYQRHYSDAQTICREFGAPHLFITFTVNNDAPEFKKMLWPGQDWYNRPDIADRLFIDKSNEFMKDLVQRQVMGPVKAWFYCVEHQKRGLPHIHMVLILDWDKMNYTPQEYIDDYISAEIPDLPRDGDNSHGAKLQRLFRNFVVDNMYHTCSENNCLVDGKCSKHFPKRYSETTVVDDQLVGVQYRRRAPAPTPADKLLAPDFYGNKAGYKDNRYMVPHNRFLMMKYRSHINVEWMQGDACIKYVLKYVMKGTDMAFVQVMQGNNDGTGNVVMDYDEMRQIRMVRYQTPNEAVLSIWGQKIVGKSHQVDHQRVHLPGEHRIVIPAGREEQYAAEERDRIERGEDQRTPLTSYFAKNIELGQAVASKHTFLTFSLDYWYDKPTNTWHKRERRLHRHLSMIYAASPGNIEEQALRMLILHTPGPTGWHDLYNNHPTFIEAAKARGLFEDSTIWVETILEAIDKFKTFRRRINWVAVLFANAGIMDAAEVLQRVIADPHQYLTPRSMQRRSEPEVLQYVLFRMELVFRLQGIDCGNFRSCCERLGLGHPENFEMTDADLIEAEYNAGNFGNRMWELAMVDDPLDGIDDDDGNITSDKYKKLDAEYYPKLYDEQRHFVNALCASLLSRKCNQLDAHQQIFMLTGDGGTGKTFTYNALISRLKSLLGCRMMVTATTGIAANLLFEGATMHSKLRIPIDIDESTLPFIDYESNTAKILRALEVLVIDEISVANKVVIGYIDRLLCSIDYERRDQPFAGKIIVFGGDWKQLLPVVDNSIDPTDDALTKAFMASVKNSGWFTDGFVNVHRLRTNMRLTAGQDNYMRKLKCWGTGVTAVDFSGDRKRYYERLEKDMCVNTEEQLIRFVFGDALQDPITNIDRLKGAAILCPLNKDTFKLNKELMKRIVYPSSYNNIRTHHTYSSVDTVSADNPTDILSVNIADKNIENIYNKTPPGIPEHKLELKVGAIMMIIVNLNVARGLCNGTRVQITKLGDNVVWCRYIQGPRAGNEFMLHRHRFKYGGQGALAAKYGAVKWTRLQYPLRPGFVMTTHKAQGQTLDRVGLHLYSSACFAHGQFYVSMSRVRVLGGNRCFVVF